MHCHLVIPALLPTAEHALELLSDIDLPALTQILSRGPATRTTAAGYDAWWCRQFGVAKQGDWPLAPLRLAADGGEPGDACWLCADPVHLQVNRDQLVLADSGPLGLDIEEAAALVAALNLHFNADGMVFQAHHPDRWYLRLPAAVDLSCTPLFDAAGRSIDTLLPTGADASRFRSMMNEMQMLLFGHAVNEKRENDGRPPVNSLWLWGGGVMPAVERPAIAKLWADESVARGFANVAHIPMDDTPADAAEWIKRSSDAGNHMIVLSRLADAAHRGDSDAWRQALAALERDWLAPLLMLLRSGRISEIVVTGLGDFGVLSVSLGRGEARRFWRKSRSLSHFVVA